MRIALLPDDYLPSSTLVHAKMFHELAHQFLVLGHEVVVITPGNENQESRLCVDIQDGVEVWRFKAGTRRGVGKLKRAVNESLLSHAAWRAIKSKVNERPFDICVNYSPTIFFGSLVKKLKKNHKTFVYLVLRDLFPQWVIDEGMIKESSIIAKYFRYFEHLNYKASDKIGLMSNANVEYFSKVNPYYKDIEVLHNWANLTPLSVVDNPSINIRGKYNLEEKVIFFYGGNIGHAQDMDNLLRLAKNMQECPEAHFLFVGQGDQFEHVKQSLSKLELANVTLLPSVNQSQYKELLTQVDIGLFSLAKTHKAHNFPGKLLGYMVQSLPILGSVNKGNDVIDYIRNSESGFVHINGEDKLFMEGAMKLLESKELRIKVGRNAYNLLCESFSVEQAAQQILTGYKKVL
ncbi:glycosyltransferase WbuB [Pseudoalteromonas sp. JC28]|uniref:glycosyltransferase family 4 protein n=1 Tax=Pseudoalteromonas sp. JC28 TaxID=2267617 RepID=UPI0015737606|nr:glycosyltransferase family 4 protein [Pseudoalteromonas sp. JC28]NSY35191.1 glycosyltransferase WbuB [Pseudoalteromonas sp. JC28]